VIYISWKPSYHKHHKYSPPKTCFLIGPNSLQFFSKMLRRIIPKRKFNFRRYNVESNSIEIQINPSQIRVRKNKFLTIFRMLELLLILMQERQQPPRECYIIQASPILLEKFTMETQ
jgi:hypothetical protein